MRLIVICVLMAALGGCGVGLPVDDSREASLMEETRVAIENLKGRMDLEYPVNAEVWDKEIRVIAFSVGDPTSDYEATVESVVEALDQDEGKWFVVFLTDKRLEDGEWVLREPNSTLILAKFDAVSGREVN